MSSFNREDRPQAKSLLQAKVPTLNLIKLSIFHHNYAHRYSLFIACSTAFQFTF